MVPCRRGELDVGSIGRRREEFLQLSPGGGGELSLLGCAMLSYESIASR